jgi:hypothetical protein
MNWEEELITLYLVICKEYKESLWVTCQRFTNGGIKSFTDEEAITLYLFGIRKGLKEIKAIHTHIKEHLNKWFPHLPGYEAFVYRLNKLSESFRGLIERLQAKKVTHSDNAVYLVDSFPIALAKHQHAYSAKVAPELASKSYNSTKKMYYYGVKAHVVARQRPGSMPEIEIVVLEEAARQDGPVFDQIRPMLSNNLAYGDQAYKRPDSSVIEVSQNLKVVTPITKERGQQYLDAAQKLYSTAVSRIRQPIETLFGWIQRKTGIQNAGLVRSTKGLLTHIFGRLLAALIFDNLGLFDF